MAESPLRKFLKKQPQPASLRCVTSEGDERIVRIGQSASRWRDAEEVCASFVRVDAVDESGAILRTYEAPEDDSAELAPAARSAPAGGKSELAQLAALLAEAADRAAARHEQAYRLAYEQQRLLVEVTTHRLAMLEKAYHRLFMSMPPNVVTEEVEGSGDDGSQMVQLLLGQALSGGLANMMQPQPQPGGSPKRPPRRGDDESTNGKAKQ